MWHENAQEEEVIIMAKKKNKIKFGDYFIADVALCPSNPVHRVIAICDSCDDADTKSFTLFSSGYESPRRYVNPERDLHYFSIVEKIDAASASPDMFRAPEKKVSYDF